MCNNTKVVVMIAYCTEGIPNEREVSEHLETNGMGGGGVGIKKGGFISGGVTVSC